MTSERTHLIWSNHHKAWWGPNGNNYYKNIANAGRYALTDTLPWLGRGCGCCQVPDVPVLVPSAEVLPNPGALAAYAVSAPKKATREAIKAGRVNRYAKPKESAR